MSSHFTDIGYLLGAIVGIAVYLVEVVLSKLPVDSHVRIKAAIENGTRPTLAAGGIGFVGYSFTGGDLAATAAFAVLALIASLRDRRVVKKSR